MTELHEAIEQDADTPENALDDAENSGKEQKRSLRGAINAYCRSCGYDDTPRAGLGAWREQIEACAVTKCPLYEVRPMSRRREPLVSE